jgi:hypothetical protein
MRPRTWPLTSCQKPRIYTSDSAARELNYEVQKVGATFALVSLVVIATNPNAALLELEQKEMELTTRLCGPGDEQALSLVHQATILETYAGITDGGDVIKYVTTELSVTDFTRIVASDRVCAWCSTNFTRTDWVRG